MITVGAGLVRGQSKMFCTTFTLRRARFSRGVATRAALVLLALCACASAARAADPWQAKLDAAVRFYQTTDVGVLVVGTEKSLYGLDAETGDVLWRRKGDRKSTRLNSSHDQISYA